jgi:hypothetical protein
LDLNAENLLELYKNRKFASLGLDADMVEPAYEGYSIANLPASVSRWLGAGDWPTRSLADEITHCFNHEYRQVILLVMDGMGWELIQRLMGDEGAEDKRWQDTLRSGTLLPLTSITPATTSAALVSFWTGRTPSQHGITGYEMWLREYNLAANMITHSPALFEGLTDSLRYCGFNPETFLETKTLAPFLAQAGIETRVLQSNTILGSGLSKMIFPRAQQIPVRSLNDLFLTLEQIALDGSKTQRYLYAYWGNLDELQHVYGPGDERVEQEFRSFQHAFMRFIRNLQKKTEGDTLVLVTADHGLTPTMPTPGYEVRRHPDLLDKLHLLPTGESRLPYLHVKPGQVENIKEVIEKIWPDEFIAVESEKAFEAGIFGPPPYHPNLLSRLGDLVLFSRGGTYLYWQQKENRLMGRHGGLSKAEMLVPLFLFEC